MKEETKNFDEVLSGRRKKNLVILSQLDQIISRGCYSGLNGSGQTTGLRVGRRLSFSFRSYGFLGLAWYHRLLGVWFGFRFVDSSLYSLGTGLIPISVVW